MPKDMTDAVRGDLKVLTINLVEVLDGRA